MSMKSARSLTIEAEDWETIREADPEVMRRDGRPIDGRERLVASIVVNGTYMHVDAVEVTHQDDPVYIGREYIQCPQAEEDEWRLDAMFAMEEPGSPFEMTEIGGRYYVVGISPFAG